MKHPSAAARYYTVPDGPDVSRKSRFEPNPPARDRRHHLSCVCSCIFWACAGQTKLFRLAAKIPGTIHDRAAWICQRLAVPSARDTRRGTSPPPSGVLSWRPQAPYAGGRFSLATDWLYGDTAAPKVRGTVAPSHQSDSDFRRGANCFDCAQSHVVLFDPRRLRTTAMIDTVTMVLALMSGSIFLAHALDGLRSRA